MTQQHKDLDTIFLDQQMRRENLIAAGIFGLFADKKSADIYHERIAKISEAEVKAVNQCIKAIGRNRNV